MKRYLLLAFALLYVPGAHAVSYTSYQNFCQLGGKTVATSGIVSTTKVQASYPLCTVSVYAVGTTTLVTIYSDALGTVKPNPFTANVDGSFLFYANADIYPLDVTISGAGISPPFTYKAVLGRSGGGTSGCDPLSDVCSLNTFFGDVSIIAGANVTVTNTAPDTITISATGGGGGTGCIPSGGGPYPTNPGGFGEIVRLNNAGTDCTSSENIVSDDGTMLFQHNSNIEMQSEVDPSGEQTLIQPTFWQMLSSTGNGGPAQLNLQIDDSAGTGGGNPLVIQMGIVKDSPGAGWAGIDLQPSIGGASKNKDLDSILIEPLSAHFGQTMRNNHGIKIQMNGNSGSTEEDGLVVEASNSSTAANYCDIITREPSGTVRVALGCGTAHTSTFAAPVSVPEIDITGTGPASFSGVEGTPCPTPAAGADILCANSVAHAYQVSNNGGAYAAIGNGPFAASLTTTAATTDNVTVTGMTATGHCSLTATNASAATNIATTYISAKATDQITVTHAVTASMTYDLLCSSN